MDYFKILNFDREPFSNSPDPDFFYHSRQHVECLQKIELSVRLRRGLSVVIGDVGTGKTTLCRQLIRKLSHDDRVETHLILDPYFSTPREFLSTLATMLTHEPPDEDATDWQLTETIKRRLLHRGVDQGNVTVLIVDEGQKIPGFCLEILRELLNYETNTYKLLQIVIFAQWEFQQVLEVRHNFMDRINMRHDLVPLGFHETHAMIRFRLDRAHGLARGAASFSLPAVWAVYRATGGYPRKVIHLCHRLILNLIVRNRTRVTYGAVRSCTRAVFPEFGSKRRRRYAVVAGGIAFVILAALTPPVMERLEFRGREYGPVSVPVESRLVKKAIPAPEGAPVDRGPHLIGAEASPLPDSERIEVAPPLSPLAYAPEPEPLRTFPAAPQGEEIASEGAPPFLGQIKVRRGDYLVAMLRRIYGRDEDRLLEEVLRANAHLRNPDIIGIGQTIRFPAIPTLPEGDSPNACRIQVALMTDLEKAYRFVQKHSIPETPIRMVPCWSGEDGLRFVLVVRRPFVDEAAAREGLKQLPSSLMAQASVLSKWDEGTIFFGEF